jgi:hypothetical protein
MDAKETDIVLRQYTNDLGTWWHWQFTYGGETLASGTETTEGLAMNQARQAREDWEYRNDR